MNKSAQIVLSILIPAYKAAPYIRETLRSIYDQEFLAGRDDFEVVVGIDDCLETLQAILHSGDHYPNLRIIMMDSNQGTYVTQNTLVDASRGERLLIFGADDIMKPGMLGKIMQVAAEYDVVRYYCERVRGSIGPSRDIVLHHGSFLANRRVFERLGGFKPWRCAADTDFHNRIPPDISCKHILESLFYYRVHDKALTQTQETGMDSAVRKAYIRQTASGFEFVRPVVNTWKEVDLTLTQS